MYHVSAQGVDERMIKLMYIIIKHVRQVQPVLLYVHGDRTDS